MQEDFLISPVNRQTGCKQFTSSVVGGPATTVLSPCSVFVCNDICSTGNLTYSITPIADYYGKRLVILKTQNTTGTGFVVRVQLPGLNTFNTTATDTLNLPDLPSTVELVFPIGSNVISDTTYNGSTGGGVAAMTPTVLGTAYGSQAADTDNHLGFENNVVSGSRSNAIGSYLSAFTMDESNLMSAYQNFIAGTPSSINRSNCFLSSDSSELNSLNYSHILGAELKANGLDLEKCVYIGNLVNVIPTTVSICLTNDLYGGVIQMAEESVYFGSNRNTLTLNNNEFHIDFRCDRWFYHDLAGGTATEILYYEPSSGQITWGAAPVIPPTPVTLYTGDGSLTGARTVNLNANDLAFTGTGGLRLQNTGALEVGANNTTSLTVGRNGVATTLNSNSITLNNIPNALASGYVTYNTATKVISYATYNEVSDAFFSYGSATNTGVLGGLAVAIINWSLTDPPNHTGYYLGTCGAVNPPAGGFIITQTSRYQILFKVDLNNDTVPGRWELQLFNNTTSLPVCRSIGTANIN